MKSVWSAQTLFTKRDTLTDHLHTDVMVIGAGIAGILTAYLLQKQGASVVVLEANEIANGVTAKTTAKITSQHNLIYDNLISGFGEEQARQYATANQRAVQAYRELIAANNIDCHFQERNAYVYSLDDVQRIEKEVEAANQLGIAAQFINQTSLPFPVKGAVEFPDQAQFHPLAFIQAIAKDLTIYEHSKVNEIKDGVAVTDHGSVTSKNIVVATHYPFINAPGYYFMRMHQQRSYVLALENAAQLDGMYIDADEQGYSFRNFENLLLLGGGGHRTGKYPEWGGYPKLRAAAKEFYPDAQEQYAWSTQDCMTLDGVPYIGRYSANTPNLYVATGFNKWGMTSSMVSAMVLSDLIAGKGNDCAQVFSPQRFKVTASMENLVKDGAQSVAGLAAQVLQLPSTELEQIENGHGGIVEYEGEKVGVYKNQDGEVFLISTKCPHLGCQLAWNPDEQSWDCPCHGSRFDYRGNLLDNPAMRDADTPDAHK